MMEKGKFSLYILEKIFFRKKECGTKISYFGEKYTPGKG